MSDTVNVLGHHLRLICCGNCGVFHAIPVLMYDNCVEEGGYWHCPNGHSRGFKEGRRDRERLQRDHDRLKQQNARLSEEAEAAERARLKAEKALQSHKRRSAAGVCPCCKRSFVALKRHMTTKHPDFGQVVPLKAAAT